MEGTVINDKGERVIPASRRPDGTLRKEVRVKAGYIPQDEQPVYQSRGALAKQGVPRVPGMEDSEINQAKSLARSKAAKKNEKRKQKKVESGPDASTAARKQGDSIVDQLEDLKVSDEQADQTDSAFTAADKNARALRKKLKQVDALLDKQKSSVELTGPELEKIKKAVQWGKELEELAQYEKS